MKKLIAILLCLAMLILPGCGEKEDVYLLLGPEEADLEMAPNVYLEGDEAPYNLTNWTRDDEVWWTVVLPQKDTYTLRFWYSMPSDYEPCDAWVAVIPMEGDVINAEPFFFPSSADGGWETYDYHDVTMELPAGDTALCLDTYEIPEGQDYFINLRAVEIFNGELAPVEPYVVNDMPDAPVETGSEIDPETVPDAEVDGTWWVSSGGMPSGGMNLADAIFLNMETLTCDLYNVYGEHVDSFPFTAEDDKITVDLGDMGEMTYFIENDCLVDPFEGTLGFDWVEEPEFLYSPDFDGTWYRCGDPENPSYYEIEDGTYRKISLLTGEPTVELEGSYSYGTMNHYVNDLAIYDVPHFLTEASEDYYPVMDGAAFFVEEDLRYQAYVSEAASDPEYVWAWMAVEDLLNGGAVGTASDGTELILHFEGFGFYVTMFAPNGERLDGAPHGSWLLREDEYMEMESADGDWLEFPIPEDGDTILFPFNGEDVVLTVSTPSGDY